MITMTTTMSNEKMIAGRYQRWAIARAKVAAIKAHLQAGGHVMVVTSLKATLYKPKHAEYFEARKNGAFVKRGKAADCIDFTQIRFSKETK